MIWIISLLVIFAVFKLLTSQRRCRTLYVAYKIARKGWEWRIVDVYDNSRLMALLMRLRFLSRTVDGWCPLSIHLPGKFEETEAAVLAHEVGHIPDQHECGWARVFVHPARSLWLMYKHGYQNSPLEIRARNAEQLILRGTCTRVWVDPEVFEGMKQ